MSIILFILTYLLLIVSVIGYGFFFSTKCTNHNKNVDIGYMGIYGIFILTLISYLTNLFLPHNFNHNLVILIVGIYFFFKYFTENKKLKNFTDKKYLIFFLALSLFAIFFYKNHDDFPYYHLSFIHNITLNKVEFGLGNFELAYNHVSSLFFFHSLFKLPFTGDYFYFIGPASILVFVNTILIKNIFQINKNRYFNFNNFLSLFIFLFINSFFYRLAEHGTDRSAMILIFLMIFILFQILESKILDKSKLENFIILLTLIISIKAFYAIYAALFLIIYFKFYSLKKMSNFLNNYKIIYFSIIFCFLILFYNIVYTGCLIYPVAVTCFESFYWAVDMSRIESAMNWYELWSKAGATPTYRVENPIDYIAGFNWVQNWVNNYFFNKVSDTTLGLLFVISITLIFFKPKKFIFKYSKEFNIIFISLLIYFFEWFYHHPALRYGGFHLLALLIFIPTSIYLSSNNFMYDKNIKKIKVLLTIGIIVFVFRNIDRIIKEVEIYKYEPIKSPQYHIQPDFYKLQRAKNEIFLKTNNCLKKFEKNRNCKIIKGYTIFY